jgi:predicted nucleotide-binding protein
VTTFIHLTRACRTDDFERSGFGHFLDNADADVLREMVRISVAENKQLRRALIMAMIKLHNFVVHSGTTFEEEAARLARVKLSRSYEMWGHEWREADE